MGSKVIQIHTIPAVGITQILVRTIHEHGKPNCVRVDRGPKVSNEFKDWCERKEIAVQYTQPGKPMQNGYIERFNSNFMEIILHAYLFEDINQVQLLAYERMEY